MATQVQLIEIPTDDGLLIVETRRDTLIIRPPGDVGPGGPKGEVTVESTVTGAPGSPALVEDLDPSPHRALLRFTIPQGEPSTVPGPPGGSEVSADPGNTATLGSDDLIFVPPGITDHGALTGLDDPDHPIAAVQGLQEALDGKAPLQHSHELADLPSTLATDAEVTAALAGHVAAADPHQQYHTDARGDARYDPVGSATAAVGAHAGAADPHPQYLTGPEGAAAFAPTGHTHTQDQSHGAPDTDATAASLHHTLGPGPTQAAPGNHGHTPGSIGAETAGAVAAHEAAADPHPGYQLESERGNASGYPSLDGTARVPIWQLPVGTAANTVAPGIHGHTPEAVGAEPAGTVAAHAATPGHELLSTTTPAPLGTAAVGVGTTTARSDHVHAMPTAANVGAEPAGSIAAHVDDPDPHVQYLKPDDVHPGTNVSVVRTADTVTISSTGGSVGVTDLPWGAFSTIGNLTTANTTVAYPIPYGTNIEVHGLSHSTTVNPERIYVDVTGVYNVVISAQLDLAVSPANQQIDLWMRINGEDLVDSTLTTIVSTINSQVTAEASYIVHLNAGDHFSFHYRGSNTNCRLISTPAASNPVRPAAPAVVVSVNMESPVLAESGIPEGGAAGQVLIKSSTTNFDVEWADPPETGGGSVEVFAEPDEPDASPGAILWVDIDDTSFEGSGGGGLPLRATATMTTASLAAGASEQGTIELAPGYRLLHITTSASARVRLYTTAAKRSADLARPSGTDPTGDHGVVFDFTSTPELLAADLSPLVDGFDGKVAPDGQIPISVTNVGAGAASIEVEMLYIRTE